MSIKLYSTLRSWEIITPEETSYEFVHRFTGETIRFLAFSLDNALNRLTLKVVSPEVWGLKNPLTLPPK